jgi:murein DD-endopeptidase MepM/ murein hydrolase activator NlpD
MRALKYFFSTSHFLTLTIFFSLGLLVFTVLPDLPSTTALPDANASVGPSPNAVTRPSQASLSKQADDESYEISGELLAGDTLGKSFARNHVPPQIGAQVLAYLKQRLDFRKLRPGERYSFRVNENEELLEFIYEIGPLESYTVKQTEQGYQIDRDKKFLDSRKIRISGEVSTTLFGAFPDDIKSPKLIYAFADIFSARIDFNTETRFGDRFDLIVEEYYLAGNFIGYGPILAGRYEGNDGALLEAFRYNPSDSEALDGYFDRDGNELGASFLRSPVQFGRVSSRFTSRRMHPVLGVVRPHLGVDLAAPRGTPVMAAADGKIVFLGTNGGFGKQIIIAHGNDYRTHYGHLARFNKDLRVGSRVKQKQIIGYVGSTGISTGPHLDYRVQVHGNFKNPFSLKYRPKSILQGETLARLRKNIAPLISELYMEHANTILATSSLVVENDRRLALL